MLFLRPRTPPKWVGRSDHSDPKKFPPRSARRSVGRSRPTRFFLRRAPRGSAGRSVGRKLRPDFFSPRRVGGSVGRTRPTQNWRSPQHLSRSVDTKVFPSGHCRHPTLRVPIKLAVTRAVLVPVAPALSALCCPPPSARRALRVWPVQLPEPHIEHGRER